MADRAAQFLRFHLAHPEIYAELLRLSRRAKASGRRRLGIRMLWEVMRWNLTVVTGRRSGRRALGDDEFALNDHWPPFYARLLMSAHPELDGLFELRGHHGR